MKTRFTLFLLQLPQWPVRLWKSSICLVFFVSFGFYSRGQAQNIIWDKTFGGNENDDFSSIKPTSDGGYILGGTSNSGVSGDKSEDYKDAPNTEIFLKLDYWIVKIDSKGKKVWDRTLGSDKRDQLTTVQQTSDGGYILGGTSDSGIGGDKTQASRGNTDYWIIKLRADGTKVWDKTYGGNSVDQLNSIKPTSDGGYILGGTSFSGSGGDKTQAGYWGYEDYWIIKLKADGTKEWDKTFGGNYGDILGSVQQLRDGSYIINGGSFSKKGFDKSEEAIGDDIDFWLIKLNYKGEKIWDKTVGTKGGENGSFKQYASLIENPDGSLILGGTTSSSDKNQFKSQEGKGGQDFWVLKLTADGTKIWDTTIGGNNNDELVGIQLTSDGGYILGGTSTSLKSSDKSEPSFGTYDYWVVKLDAAGKFIGDKTVQGDNQDILYAIEPTPDGNFILGGTSNSDKGYNKSENTRDESENGADKNDYWIVKIDDEFTQNQTITFAAINNLEVGATLTLSAKASSGLPVNFNVLSGPAKVKGNKLILTGSGTVRVEAVQFGNEQYKAADISQTFESTLTGKQWQTSYGSSKADFLTTLLPTADGGYIMGGRSTAAPSATGDKSQAGPGSTDYWVVKTDKTGKKLWDRTYGGLAAENLTALLATPDGGYLLGGSSASGVSGNKHQASQGKTDYWLLKIDAQGNIIWDRAYGGAEEDNLTALLATPDGGYLLGGSSVSGNSGDKSQAGKGSTDYWILKVNSNGTKLWDKTFGGNDSDNLTAMVRQSSGGYLLGGTSYSGVSGDKSQAPRGLSDYWVISITEKGTKGWDYTYGGIKVYDPYDFYFWGASELTTIIPDPDGGYIIGGSSSAAKGGEKSQKNRGQLVTDYWIVKINSSGKKIWDRSYGGRKMTVGGFYDVIGNSLLSSIVPVPNGGYLLGGTSDSYKGGDKSEENRYIPNENSENHDFDYYPTAVYHDFWLLKVDEQGRKAEDRTIGGNKYVRLSAIVITPEGNFLLGGISESGISGDKSMAIKGEADYWLVEVSKNKLPEPEPNPLTAWDMRYGSYNYNGSELDNDKLTDVIKTADGGYLSAGFSMSLPIGDKSQDSKGKYDYWIVKSDQNGTKLWDKTFGGSDADYLSRVIRTQDGGYLLAGSSLSGKGFDKSEASQGQRDYWLVKTDALGNKQWDKTIGGSGYEELIKVIQLASGEYVLGGYSNSPVSGTKSQASRGGLDYWLVKISATGTLIWDKRYGGLKDETLGSFTQTPDGGFLLAGTSFSGTSGDKTQGSRSGGDYWVLKVDKAGHALWDKTYGGSGADEAYSIGRSGADYFIAGTSTSGQNGDKSQVNQGGKDYWLLKVNPNGTKLWDKTFGGNQDDELRASTFTDQGTYILGGSSLSDISGDKTQPSRGGSDYWLVEVAENGEKVQDRRFGGTGTEELRTVFQTPDGGLLLGGSSTSDVSGEHSQTTRGGSDYWLVKLAPEKLTLVASRQASGIEAPTTLTHHLIAYPNPFQNHITISFSLPETQAATLKIYDSQGRKIKTLFQGEAQANQKYEVQWQADKKPAGLYFLQLQTPTQNQQQKILLSK